MPRKSKYLEQYEMVLETLKEYPGTSISKAVQEACESTGIEYHERIRKAINHRLVKHDLGKNIQKESESPSQFKEAQSKTFDKTKDTFIITWAQNATPIHEKLWSNIEAYADRKNAAIHVIAGRYKNPTSVWNEKQETDEWWDENVIQYLDANRHNVHKYLQVLSDIKIQPTAATPLSGMQGITGEESCVIGHPRQHIKSLPTLEGYKPKLLLSTGACTVSNYTDSKAGKKGEFHHMLGFVIVELVDDFFLIRQVNADNEGNFYDVTHRAKDGKISINKDRAEAVILGDVHVNHNNKEATEVAFQFIDFHQPKNVVIHDVFEAESIIHWDEKSPFRLMEKGDYGIDNLEKELEGTFNWIENAIKRMPNSQLVFSRSNHDDMLDRWLDNSDWRKIDNVNKRTYLRLAGLKADNREARRKGILPFMIDVRFKREKVTTLSLDDSFRVKGWELSMHGHIGANGSRGSAGQFKNLNTKNIVGHRHTPERVDGHIAVGTLTHLRVGFNRGPSSWLNGFAVIWPDGKAQLLHIINGRIAK